MRLNFVPGSFGTAAVHVADGKVASVGLSLIYESQTTHGEMLKVFTSKWGRGIKTAEGWNFHDGPRLIQIVDLGDTDFQINLKH